VGASIEGRRLTLVGCGLVAAGCGLGGVVSRFVGEGLAAGGGRTSRAVWRATDRSGPATAAAPPNAASPRHHATRSAISLPFQIALGSQHARATTWAVGLSTESLPMVVE
jgi:hypothetical protein